MFEKCCVKQERTVPLPQGEASKQRGALSDSATEIPWCVSIPGAVMSPGWAMEPQPNACLLRMRKVRAREGSDIPKSTKGVRVSLAHLLCWCWWFADSEHPRWSSEPGRPDHTLLPVLALTSFSQELSPVLSSVSGTGLGGIVQALLLPGGLRAAIVPPIFMETDSGMSPLT